MSIAEARPAESGSAAKNVAIVGASAAGVSAAVELRRRGFLGEITLVDKDCRTPYERPPLSKSIIDSEGDGLRPIVPEITYAEYGIELVLGQEVTRIDPDRGELVLDSGEVRQADDIVLATGVSARPLDVPGANLPGVLLLRDAADASALRNRLDQTRRVVIVGAGFIGLELAALMRGLDIDVTVVDIAGGPLVHAFGEEIGELIRRLHEDRGVTFRFGTGVSRVAGRSAVEGIVLTDGSALRADLVVSGIGVVPRTELARAAGVVVDEYGIVVDSCGRTSHPHVYACGDVASQPHPSLPAPGRIEHWDTAMKHGAAVGATIAGQPTPFTDLPYAWSDQYDLTLQYFGRRQAGDTFILRDGSTPSRFLAFWFRGSVMSAVLGCDMRREVGIARRLIGAGRPLDPAAFAAADLDLKAIHRPATMQTRTKPLGPVAGSTSPSTPVRDPTTKERAS
ncbi:FAD-dependent oxidoreductase [Sphaerisporangium sp. NPDC051011]|uniref:NAD(P)/FAD-dependent oxidoreductase n=1 Tax=Sphaerisporangium sp. NPDC051011 TaxID=3155792 RepID=UPI0033D412EF